MGYYGLAGCCTGNGLYGFVSEWEYGAHLPDAGIFRSVSLIGVKGARLDGVYIRQEHLEEKVVLHFSVTEKAAEKTVSREAVAEKADADIWEKRIGLRTLTMKVEKDEWGKALPMR